MTRTPKRKIVVHGIEYEWCIRGDPLYAEYASIYKPLVGGTPIYLDIIPFDVEIRPRTIKNTIDFALANGWKPEEKAKAFRVGFANENFIVLPEGVENSLEYELNFEK